MAASADEQTTFYRHERGNPVIKFCRRFWTVRNLKQKLPVAQWIRQYKVADFIGDLTAGLTLGVTVLPQGLANGVLAGLAPQYGLYTAFMGCFIYFILGTAKDINLGPTAIMSLMVDKLGKSPVENDGTYAVALALGCGVIQSLMGLLHLGYLVQYISHAVIAGFTSAAAITIGVGQLSKLLGIRKVRNDFFEGIYDTFDRIKETNLWDMGMGLVGVAVLIALKKLKELLLDKHLKELTPARRCHRRSAMAKFVVLRILAFVCTARNAVFVMLASVLAATFSLGSGWLPFTLTAKVETSLPSLAFPSFAINQTVGNITIERTVAEVFQDLSHGFVIISLVGILEQIAIGKSFAARNKYRINPNQEIFAMGMANVFGSFVSAFPVTASFSRSAINSASGVRTPASGIVTGTVVLIALAVLTPYFVYVPQSALSAVIICAVMDMIDYEFVLMLWKVKRWDLIQFFCTFLPSFPLGIEYGILIGVGMSAMMLMYPLARPGLKISYVALPSERAPYPNVLANGQAGACECSAGNCAEKELHQVAVVEPSEGLKFAGAEYIYDKVIKHGPFSTPPRHVVLDCCRFTGFDSGTVQALAAVGDVLKKHGLMFVLANVPAGLDSALTRYECKVARADGVTDALRVIEEGTEAADDMPAALSKKTTALDPEDVVITGADHQQDRISTAQRTDDSSRRAALPASEQSRDENMLSSNHDLPATDSSARLLSDTPTAEDSCV